VYSHMCFNATAVRRLRMGTMPWLGRAGKTAITVAVAVVAFLTTVGIPPASAGRSLYPGEMCMKWSGAGTPKYYYGGIGNQSTTDWLYLDCPLVTDPAYNDPQAYGYIIAWVELRDLHPSADISCTLYNVANAYSDGSYFYKWVGPVTSASSGYPPQLLGFWGLATLDASNATLPVNYLSCAIPPSYNGSYRSYIINYSSNQP
jgi:hypothetical protein